MKLILSIGFTCFCLSGSFAQTELLLYKDSIPNSIPSPNQEKVTKRYGGADWISDVSIPTLTSYLVEKPGKKVVPAVIICPGGGYTGLSIVREGYDIAKELNRHGIAAFVLKYRLPNDKTMKEKSIGPLQDAQEALLTVRQNAEKWHIDTTYIGIMGFSAGGHLASTTSTHYTNPVISTNGISVRPGFSILLYPVISFEDSLMHRGSMENLIGKNPPKQLVQLFSNEKQVSASTPPTFIVHAEDDKVVKVQNTLYYYQSLLKNGVQAEMLIYPKGGHGFGLNNSTTSDKWLEHCIQWMNDYVLNKKM